MPSLRAICVAICSISAAIRISPRCDAVNPFVDALRTSHCAQSSMDLSQLSCVALDVDHTLIRSIRTPSATNPYPHFQSQHIEDYFHFSLRTERRRSNSHSATRSTRTRSRSRSGGDHPLCHYHIYTRPGLKSLFTFLRWLQSETKGRIKMVVASMAKRDYVEAIMRGLESLFTLKKCPTFDVR